MHEVARETSGRLRPGVLGTLRQIDVAMTTLPPNSARFPFLAMVAAVFLLAALSPGGLACAEPAAPAPMLLAQAVPMPRLNPNREPADPIATLINQQDTIDAAVHEDREVFDEQSIAADVPLPTIRTRADSPLDLAGLRLALSMIERGDPAGATVAAYALPNRVDIKLVDWLVATSGDPDVPSARIAEVRQRLGDWPGQGLLRLRYEQALLREEPSAAEIVARMGGTTPTFPNATLSLVAAYMEVGRRADATRLLRDLWRQTDVPESIERAVLQDFRGLLTAADHKARMDRLLYDGRATDGVRVSALLDANQQSLAKAVSAVIKGQSGGLRQLESLPAAVRSDPLATYARVQALRRANRITDAGNLLVAAPRDPAALIDPDAWWVERRLVSRALNDIGKSQLAYAVAAGHSAQSSALRAEAEFHAGWFALEFLHDPGTAARHFTAVSSISTRPLTASRAEFWLGRSAEAQGNSAGATAHYQRAAAYPSAFYGQLAAARLGRTQIALATPSPTAAARERFAARELVQAIDHLTAVGEVSEIDLFYRHLAATLTDPGEVAMLAAMASNNGEHQLALQIGVTALGNGVPADALAFPTGGIPASADTGSVEKPLVYAVARQESNFNPEAVSSVGARGLLQLMPATARESARVVGVSYSADRLTADPAYNVSLGSSYLGRLVNQYRGSYVMAAAAYNAGGSRVDEWVERYGDPRDPRIDVINWIERIPFTQTRDYVQRVMENLQAYRARLGSSALTIEADLRRGGRG
jgi:soluble lytic murein transglycosylase